MKHNTQLKMEICRQSGETIVGTVTVNQENFTFGSSSVSLTEQSLGELQILSLNLKLLQEEHWIFDGLAQKAPVRIYLPFDPKPEKMTALYLFSDWWTRPAFVEHFEDIPPKTQVLLLKGKDRCACLVPMVGQQWKATVSGGTETEVCLEMSSGMGGLMSLDETICVLAEGDTVSDAVHRAFTWIAREKGIPMRCERRIPEQFRSLGWCSWNAFYTDVDEAGLRRKAEEFVQKSVPVRWVMIDDGWMSTQDTFLTDYVPDRKKFPNGFAQMTKDIRQNSTIQKFGVWHALGGYWSGIRKDSKLAALEADHLKECVGGPLVPSPDERGAEFYRHWYQMLRREGIEFVKVDGQSTAARYFENTLPISAAVRGMNEALESGASVMDNNVLNCMGMAMENVLARPASAVSRNSDDFFPDREGSFTEHLLENAYNAIYHNELYCCDWDMFWTSHPDGKKHSLLRAISGGPVYFSDRVGETDPDVLKSLCYLDGTLPMMMRSARPAEDCVFTDPQSSGVLKLHNAAEWGNGIAGGIAVFNLTSDRQSFSFTPRDIPEIEEAGRYWIYDWFGKCACSVGKDEHFKGAMDAQGFGWYVVLPEKETASCLGLRDKFVGFAAVESVTETSGSTVVVLRETGTISWLSNRKLRSAELNGEDVTDLIECTDSTHSAESTRSEISSVQREDEKNASPNLLFTLPLEEKSAKAVLCLKW